MTANTIANVEMTPQLETTEIRLKKLLVAIDFSEQTPRTLEAAISIAKSFGSELSRQRRNTRGVWHGC